MVIEVIRRLLIGLAIGFIFGSSSMMDPKEVTENETYSTDAERLMANAKKKALSDPRFNELYREGRRMTGFGDNR